MSMQRRRKWLRRLHWPLERQLRLRKTPLRALREATAVWGHDLTVPRSARG